MPKSYSEKERKIISDELRATALNFILKKGIKKTTVDELVNKVHIPKGTFYLFYPSKEMLFYDAIMQQHNVLHKNLSNKLIEIKDNISIESLTTLLYDAFTEGFNTGILQLMISGELEILIRKLPNEVVSCHLKNDDDFFMIFKVLFPKLSEQETNEYSAAFRALFFTAAYKREIGENYNASLIILIRGLIIQMIEVSK